MARMGGCPECGCHRTSVRRTEEKKIKWRGKETIKIRRTRRCGNCGYQWFSLELTEDEVLDAELILDPGDIDET